MFLSTGQGWSLSIYSSFFQELTLLAVCPLTPYFIHAFIYSSLHSFICSFILESFVKQYLPFFHCPLHAHIKFYTNPGRNYKEISSLNIIALCFGFSVYCCLIFLLVIDPVTVLENRRAPPVVLRPGSLLHVYFQPHLLVYDPNPRLIFCLLLVYPFFLCLLSLTFKRIIFRVTFSPLLVLIWL